MKDKGFVYLVGAGPGRADLITVRGAELIRQADCIICDKLVNPALLKYARPDAEIIYTPKRIGKGSATQDQINQLLLEKAAAGKSIVRLKGGDPYIFGRCTEEAAILAEAGIGFEVVPGITAAIAASEYAGIILTDRNYSSQLLFVTGHEAEGKEESNIDWPLLARFRGTIAFYMGIGNLDYIVRQLIQNGMSAQTPTAVIANATWPTQKLAKSPLGKISEKCRKEEIKPPAIVIIGPGAAAETDLNWFMKKPLFGKNIVVTRDRHGNADFAGKIINRGGNPVEFPTIKIKSLTDTNDFLRTLAKISEFDWIVFTSANGVTLFFEALHNLGKDSRVFGAAKIATIGSETAARLADFGIMPDFVPAVFTSEQLGNQLIAYTELKDKGILLLRSQLASNELVALLQDAGGEVANVPVYTIAATRADATSLTERITKNEIDWLTFASSSSASAFFEQVPADLVSSSSVKVASIGPVTSEQLTNLRVKVDAQATGHTLDGLLEAIEETCG
jgi:uroporphyrinogen III methyltransferase/synthase